MSQAPRYDAAVASRRLGEAPDSAGSLGSAVAAGDRELVDRFLRDDQEAVEVVDRWVARAATPFRRRLDSEWEDVLQEARLEAFRLLQGGQYRGEARLRTYLWQVTTHTFLDALRHLHRRPLADTVNLETSIIAHDPSPFDRVLGRELEQMLSAALESMSLECRELWDLASSGLGYSELSRRWGVSEGTLRVRAHRLRRRAVAALGCDAGPTGTRHQRRPHPPAGPTWRPHLGP